MRPIKEKLWTVLTTERGQVKVSMNGVPLSSKSGESYGILQEVCCTTQSGKGMIQLTFRQDGSSHKKRKVAILHARYYDRFHSSPPFNECASKDADHLAEELSKALNVHKESSSPQSSQLFHPEESVLAVNSAEKSKEHNNASKVDTPPNIDSQTFLSHDTETPVATNQPQRHKKRLSFTPEDQVPDKKSKKDTCSSLLQSCDDCLVSASSHFINIDKLELPSKVRQFRRVNESFLNSLEGEMERNPAGSYGALFVVAKGLSSKIEWKEEEKNKHSYEVLGGTHLSLATKRLHEKYPENPHFAGRMCRIYVGLSDEQAVYLGGMHQHSSMFQHEVTYREEVERCRMQLFGDRDITGEPPEPRPSWRDDCSLILGKEKKSLSEIFAMAKVSKAVWKEFQEVNSLFEMGRLKEQKVSSGEIVRGAVSLKQWHMKPLCSLTDEQRLPLLLKLKEKKISLKEVKEEAYKLKALSQVREAIVKFFKLNSWQEAETKFGASVHPERLLRFKGDFEKLHEFKMFLKHLKQKIEWADTDYANTDNCIVGPDGVTKGHVVFIKQHEDVDQNSAFLESGAFLSIAHVGYTDQDVVSEIKDVVELVVRINFKRLMTIFNIVFICPVGIYREVQEAVSLQGAAKTQFGFIVNKIPPLAREDLLMTEVVECFVVCHWAVSYNKLTERHVSRAATNVIEVIRDGSCQPRELYESLIETFSKEGDLVLDIGSANGNGMLAAVRLKRPSVSINKHTTEDMRWHLLENIREKNHFPLE